MESSTRGQVETYAAVKEELQAEVSVCRLECQEQELLAGVLRERCDAEVRRQGSRLQQES